MIRWERRDDGIVLLTLDDPEQSTNTMNTRYLAAMASTVDRLEAERDTITGVILTSAKNGFLAGADLTELGAQVDGLADVGAWAFRLAETGKDHFRRLERLGRPVVAALGGTALGGGFELALAGHHRIAVDGTDARFGCCRAAAAWCGSPGCSACRRRSPPCCCRGSGCAPPRRRGSASSTNW